MLKANVKGGKMVLDKNHHCLLNIFLYIEMAYQDKNVTFSQQHTALVCTLNMVILFKHFLCII